MIVMMMMMIMMMITSGAKMMAAEGQTVYLLVDRGAGGGQGAVIGMLKVSCH